MINIMNQAKTSINEDDKTLDPQLWHACAGSMIQMPPLNSMAFYFPQGHVEHTAIENPNLHNFPQILPYIQCRVSAIKFLADPDTDEVYSKITLIPNRNQDNLDFHNDDDVLGLDHKNDNQENPKSFAKTLTQSDANNGGGFSVPRYCAETLFPRLDYTADPPVQTILVKDVQGQIWKFRHIYRGTPRRHLLTTGWSNFVNHKKLVAGDSIVFLRADNGDLCVGIRRAKRGINGGVLGLYGFSDSNKFVKDTKAKLSEEAVMEAVKLAAEGRQFEVFYYPRGGTPEFCVKASVVKAAMRIQWCSGMRFKMAFETEDSSRISWFMGTVSSVNVEDQIRWPNSPWRLLQVSWDEPDLLQNVKRVSPWLVELVTSMPAINLSSFSPPRKKLRFPLNFPFCQLPINIPASIQGARHNFQFNKIRSSPFEILNHEPSRRFRKTGGKSEENDEKVSCLLTIGNGQNDHDEKNEKKPAFVLFGQRILTEQQLSESWSGDGSVVLQNGPVESSSDEAGVGPWFKPEFSLDS